MQNVSKVPLFLFLCFLGCSQSLPSYNPFADHVPDKDPIEFELQISSDTSWKGFLSGPYHNDTYENKGDSTIYLVVFPQHRPLCFTARKLTYEGRLGIRFRSFTDKDNVRHYSRGSGRSTKEPFGQVSVCIEALE